MMSPNELKNKSFQVVFRGYDRDEVDAFLLTVAEESATLQANYEALKLRLSKTETELAAKIEAEDAIRRALVDSQTAAAQVMESAKQKSEELENLTREKCGEIINRFRESVREERERLAMLRLQTAQFKKRLYELYQGQIETVESITKTVEEADWDQTPTEATKTVLALLRGEFERRTRAEELEEGKLDEEIDIVIDRLSRTQPADDTPTE